MSPTLMLVGLVLVGWVAYDSTQRHWSGSTFADAAWKWIIGMLLWFIVLPIS